MKVFRFYAPGDVRIEESPEPQVAAGEVKIRVRACSMCGTDVKIASAGHQRMQPPRVMGHEIAGEVVEVGEGVTGWAAGDRVQVIAAIPCGKCEFCTAGLMTICPNQLSMGYDFDGGFAPYMIVPPQVLAVDGLNRIPDGVSFVDPGGGDPVTFDPPGHEDDVVKFDARGLLVSGSTPAYACVGNAQRGVFWRVSVNGVGVVKTERWQGGSWR